MRSIVCLFLALIFCGFAGAGSGKNEMLYKPGDPGVTPPRPIYTPIPDYSEYARRQRIQGIVYLLIEIDSDGKVRNPTIQRSLEPSLDKNALQTVKKWRFSPCKKDGVPVNCAFDIQVTFHLQ